MTTALTVPEWRRAYDRVDQNNAFTCLARDWNSGAAGPLYRLHHCDVIDAAHAAAVAQECRECLRVIQAGLPLGPECEPDDYPRLVALLQACEEFPPPVEGEPEPPTPPRRAVGVKLLGDAADEATDHADTLDGLIDGQDDDLGTMLGPIRDFLRSLGSH